MGVGRLKQVPRIIDNRYVLEEQLGHGQMSSVYRALDRQRDDQVVAVKVLNSEHPDLIRSEFFRRETMALERLDHPNIVRILHSGWSDTEHCFFIVLEYLGRTFLDILREHSGRDVSWCWPIFRKMADALAYAHSEGIIHRDIKPANILFDAAGEPKLSDFGISRLKHELATGQTVGAFWSPGYASPEQRQGQAGDEASDIYALGTVLFHVLSGNPPPSDAPLASLLSDIAAPPIVQQTLRAMLAHERADRIIDITQVRRRFEALERGTENVPQILLVVTEQARRQLFKNGISRDSSYEHAKETLIQELGGDELLPVNCRLVRASEVAILGRQVTLTCTRSPLRTALVVTSIKLDFAPDRALLRSSSAQIRVDWQPIVEGELTGLSREEGDQFEQSLSSLLADLTTHEQQARVGAERRDERRSFLDAWERVIRFQQQRVAQRTVPLAYRAVADDGDTLSFELTSPSPDDLPWEEGVALAVRLDDRRQTEIPVGDFVKAQGRQVWVDTHGQRQHNEVRTRRELPSSGTLIVYQPQEQARLRRQRDALLSLRQGSTANPRLSDVLMDVSRAQFDRGNSDPSYIQPSLDLDKRRAVARALRANDIFLLQGPPGTGKTTAITELILQILARNTNARILVSSQSNVAVDHVLDNLSKLVNGSEIELLRVGRTEKLGPASRALGMEQRLLNWRDRVLGRCEQVLDELSSGSASEPPSEETENLKQCLVWIEEAAVWLHEVREKEEWQAAVIEAQQRMKVRLERDTEDLLSEIARDKDRIALHLAIVRSLLPDYVNDDIAEGLGHEVERLRGVVVNLLEGADADTPNGRTKRLVEEWRQVVGLTSEFEPLMLERSNVLGATCVYSGGPEVRDAKFDWVIIDEAGRATAPEALIPLVKGRRAVLVGDERQLPPMLDEEISKEWLASEGIELEGLAQSLFERLTSRAEETKTEVLAMLSTQYRMHPAIGGLVSDVFYDSTLQHGANTLGRDHNLPWVTKPVIWVSTSAQPNRFERPHNHSFENRLEAELILALLERMELTYRNLSIAREVGVLSGYSAQIDQLELKLQVEDRDRWHNLSIEVATVDAFQGRDRDVIIYSTTRSNPRSDIGFLKDRRRLNVALSRARELLIVVGDHDMLGRAAGRDDINPFRHVIAHIESHQQDCAVVAVSEVLRDRS